MELNDNSTATSIATRITATTAVTMMRERCACDRLVRIISASMKADVITSPPHAARENASRIASAMMPSATALRSDFAETVGDDALQDEQSGQDQKRAQHVRVLEGAARAFIERQQIMSARNQIEVAGDAGDRCNQCAPRSGRGGAYPAAPTVSSDTTIAKKITVIAMYQDVAIQLTTSGLSRKGTALMV